MSDDSLHGSGSDISQRHDSLDREWSGINHGRSKHINTDLYSGSRGCGNGSDIDLDRDKCGLWLGSGYTTAYSIGHANGECGRSIGNLSDYTIHR